MSELRRIPDVERTATMLDLIGCRFSGGRGMSMANVVLEEVAPGTGFYGASRYADVLVLGVWKSSGQRLDGFEVKASRADLKKELSDLSKHHALARYCDSWTLVAWDEKVLVDGIPKDWGVMVTRDGTSGREIQVQRKAAKRTPEPWPRQFVCSLVRNAFQQAPGGALVGRACAAARDVGHKDGRYVEAAEWRNALKALQVALFGKDTWKWPPEAKVREVVFQMAAERIAQGSLDLEGVA